MKTHLKNSKKRRRFMGIFPRGEAGQTTTEYILILVIVIALVRTLKGKLETNVMGAAVTRVEQEMQQF